MTKNVKKLEIGALQTRAAVVPTSVKPEERTVDMVWTTGARVLRTTWLGERWYEELSTDPKHIRLDRLNGGAPLLNTHRGYDVADVMGVVESGTARMKDGEGLATVRFSKREDVEPFFRDVVDGIIRNISVGYKVHRFELVETTSDEIPVYRATDWEPTELSICPVGADAGAGFRSEKHNQDQLHQCEIITQTRNVQEHSMDPEEKKRQDAAVAAALAADAQTRAAAAAPAAAAPAQPTAEQTRAAQDAGATAERERIKGIRTAVRAAKLDDSVAETLIDNGTTLEAARAHVIDELAKKDAKAPATTGQVRAEVGTDLAREGLMNGVENALLHRVNPGAHKLEDVGRNFRGMSLLEIGKEFVTAAGGDVRGLSRSEVAKLALGLGTRGGMHSTSDFPIILGNIANKTLRGAYEMAPQTWRPLAKQKNLVDYKEVTSAQFGEAPQLKEVKEHGEYTRGTIQEGGEKFSLHKYGRVLAVTREAIINDDLDVFSKVPSLFGRSAADLESDLFWAIIIANAQLSDGVALFHATHANLNTGGGSALGLAGLSAARTAFRKMKGLDKKKLLNISPRYLVVPAALETTAQQNMAITTPAGTTDVNPFVGAFQTIVEPRLDDASATAWYLFADPAAYETFLFGYLEGEEGPQIEQRVGFDVDGVEIKCRLDFYTKAVDFRGVQKNAGA